MDKMRKTKLTDEMRLYVCSMGKVFRVTHVCRSDDEANKAMEQDSRTALIASDQNGLNYLAKIHGHVAPSAIMEDLR